MCGMARRSEAAALVLQARQRAGLTQRALARRAGTAQSVVARIEAGLTDPGFDTLRSLVRAAGYDVAVDLVSRPASRTHMMRDVKRILAMTPENRLREVGAVNRFVSAAKRV